VEATLLGREPPTSIKMLQDGRRSPRLSLLAR